MPKLSLGYEEALMPTAIFLTPILYWPLPWACTARWMRREPLRRRDLRSIQASPSVACLPTHQATIRFISLDESASAWACASLGCRRGERSTDRVKRCSFHHIPNGPTKGGAHLTSRAGRAFWIFTLSKVI